MTMYIQNANEYFRSDESVSFQDDNGDEDDENLFQQPQVPTDPELCPYCNFYELKDKKYYNRDVKHCKKDGYLCPKECYSKLTPEVKNTDKTIIYCPKGHEL